MDARITDWTRFGSVVRDARLAQDLSQHELARRAGVSRSWLARVEHGHRGAELELLLRLCEALGIDLVVRSSPSADGGESGDVDLARRRSPRDPAATWLLESSSAVEHRREDAAERRRRSWREAVSARPTGSLSDNDATGAEDPTDG